MNGGERGLFGKYIEVDRLHKNPIPLRYPSKSIERKSTINVGNNPHYLDFHKTQVLVVSQPHVSKLNKTNFFVNY